MAIGYAIGEHALGTVRGAGITTLVRGDPSVGGDALAAPPMYWREPSLAIEQWEDRLYCGSPQDPVLLVNWPMSCGDDPIAHADAVFPEPGETPWVLEDRLWGVNWYNRRVDITTYNLAVANPGAESSDLSMWTLEDAEPGAFLRVQHDAYAGDWSYSLLQNWETDYPVVYQDIAIPNDSGQHAIVDQGNSQFGVSWWQWCSDTFDPTLVELRTEIRFYDASMNQVGARQDGEWGVTPYRVWIERLSLAKIPSGARTIRLGFRRQSPADHWYGVRFDEILAVLGAGVTSYHIQSAWEITATVQPQDYPRPI